MQRYRILHRTYYSFPGQVQLKPHVLRLRPREDHDLRIESSKLVITPSATLRWHRDVEDNSVAIATFDTPASQLSIENDLIIQQFNEAPLDFLVAAEAIDYPFAYSPEDSLVLSPYMDTAPKGEKDPLRAWVETIWKPGERIQTYALLQRLCVNIHERLSYQLREEPGVQKADETLRLGTGSCRDSAALFIEAARCLGLAARFVSGYLQAEPSAFNYGATHAWAEVYLPGAGWKGFDPSIGEMAGAQHIAMAVARLPESVPPVAGAYLGPPGATLSVGVWVSEL
ncbi:transglutaminase family protein [Thiorhodococcus mannitoliphagus]|uniref:Transglutaminase family protein n=1 Tax=Thiorhodococcus mannitoliphagus TaxID=329406 RepID=A0A6P1DZ64_9GAMM|nr:transglutaminase family protein [Thiorhodococcus mannitoliphagus]NEX22026.1 transglutaminase family protein [Thiorhodococcus mannitoliphagus]